MKVCYLIQTHKNPDQIYRLVRTIKHLSPDSQIVISHNFDGCNLDTAALHQLPGVQVLPCQGGRGDFSLIQRYLDAIDWLLNHDIDFDWLINLTGQDYPTQPLSEIEEFLAETSYDGFIEYFEIFSQQSHWSKREGNNRYCYKYKQVVSDLPEKQKELLKPLKFLNYIQPFIRINFSYGLMLGIRTPAPFNDKFVGYGGSFFCTLSRKCIEYLHEFSQSNPGLLEYYKGVCVPDESFIQTVLVNSHLFNLYSDCKRYFDFSGTRNGRPRILTTNDYPSLVESHMHFARKFDAVQDSKILDLLDAAILPSSQLKGCPEG